MIIIRNSQLNSDTLTVLNKLMEKEMNAKLAFKLMKIMKEISSLVDDKLKLEKKILEKYMERDEEGNSVLATDEVGYEKIDFEELNLETIKVKELMQIEFLFN